MSIPKIIHQTVPDKSNLHPAFVDNISRIKALNEKVGASPLRRSRYRPFHSEFYGADMLSYYERIDPLYGAARADFFRYLLLYAIGGVYLGYKIHRHQKSRRCAGPERCVSLVSLAQRARPTLRGMGPVFSRVRPQRRISAMAYSRLRAASVPRCRHSKGEGEHRQLRFGPGMAWVWPE